jgi:hypothetical protein
VSGFVDDAGRVSFAMPVALPHAGRTSSSWARGRHREAAGRDADRRRGGWTLDPAPPAGRPLRIAFGQADRLVCPFGAALLPSAGH